MKRIALLLGCLIAGGACTAEVRSQPTYATAYHSGRPGRVHERWVTLARGYSADTNRQFINVNSRLNTIRVEADRGAPVIRQVAIEYTDGSPTQVVKIDQQLRRGQGYTIDLNGRNRAVNRVIVYSDASYGGAYSVLGG
jgi:hypothetical protein